MNVKMKVKLVDDRASMPQKATIGAACVDIQSIDGGTVKAGKAATFRTGLSFEIPENFMMMVFSRSGHGFKKGIRLANGTGIIDSDYRGELMVALFNDSDVDFTVAPGDRIAQAVVVPVPELEMELATELSSTERGEGGFGSTGTAG